MEIRDAATATWLLFRAIIITAMEEGEGEDRGMVGLWILWHWAIRGRATLGWGQILRIGGIDGVAGYALKRSCEGCASYRSGNVRISLQISILYSLSTTVTILGKSAAGT
jgi:hypothetical protein